MSMDMLKKCRWCLTGLTAGARKIVDRRPEPGGVEVRYYCSAECFQKDHDLPTEAQVEPQPTVRATAQPLERSIDATTTSETLSRPFETAVETPTREIRGQTDGDSA